MSSYRDDDRPGYRRPENRTATPWRAGFDRLSGAGRIALWGALHFCFYLTQQIAELAAPLLLVLGAGWWALPHLLGAASHSAANIDSGAADTTSQMHDLLSNASHAVPAAITFGDHVFTPGGLIFDGILLMALAAACSTLAAIVAREI